MTPGLRRLYVPRQVTVETGEGGVPRAVEGIAVEAVREEWWVEDRWWMNPLRRHYFELVLADGRDVAVFRGMAGGHWYRQRA